MLEKTIDYFGRAEDEVLGRGPDVSNIHPVLSTTLPTTIKVIGLDLDGTMMPSYKTLKAIDYAHKSLVQKSGLSADEANKFISDYLNVFSFQSLLHRPKKTVEALDHFAKDKGITILPEVSNVIAALQKEAFTAYDGLKDVLKQAKNEGVPVFIYTNSPDYFAVKRLVAAGIDPEEYGIVALWAKDDGKHPPMSWLNDRSTAEEKRWAQATIPYTYKKPNDTPLREMAAHADVAPREILFIGEGSKDVQSAFCDPNNPAAAFCLQVKGARDINWDEQQMNERLRPGAEPLGIAAVEKSLKDLGLDNAHILRLDQGFPQLREMITAGDINLSAPSRVPYVRDRVLASDKPEARAPFTAARAGLSAFPTYRADA